MRSAAMAEARRRGTECFPVCAVDWVARGLPLGRGIYSPAKRLTSLGPVSAVTRVGGWSAITYGSGIAQSALEAAVTAVEVSDPEGELIDMLETYDPRGSAARIDWASPGLVDADWEPLFRGIVSDWSRDEPFTKLDLKTDDSVLRTPIPSGLIERTIWGSAEDGSVFGTAHPLVMGIFDSLVVTARGAVPLINVRYDKDIGYWYVLSSDRMVYIDRLYYDGVPQGAAGWSVLRGVYGQSQLTLVMIAEGYQPLPDVIVSVDCGGPDELGGSTGDTLTGSPDQLRALLEEFAYRRPPLVLWRGPLAIIDSTSWDAASAFFALHRCESARRFGADQEPESMAEVVQSHLDPHLFERIQWNELGQLEYLIIDPDDVEPDETTRLNLYLHHAGGRVPFSAGDAREVYTHLRMPYSFFPADDKFVSAIEVHDVAALAERVVLSVENAWTQARFDQVLSDLNPQPPIDPEPPS